jgi:hypothetical protein
MTNPRCVPLQLIARSSLQVVGEADQQPRKFLLQPGATDDLQNCRQNVM